MAKRVVELVPMGEMVVVFPWAAVTKQGAILLANPDQPNVGEVVAVGPDAATKVAVGDTVMYAPFAGSEHTVGPRRILLLPVGTLLGVCRTEEVGDAESTTSVAA